MHNVVKICASNTSKFACHGYSFCLYCSRAVSHGATCRLLHPCLPYKVEVAKNSKFLELASAVQTESCKIVLNNMQIHSPTQLMLCRCNDTLDQLACNPQMAVLICHTQSQNVYDCLLV